MCDSTSSALVTTIPQVYGTLLSDSAWTLNMRFRSFIWPDNLPHNLICKCSREITTTHLLNCKHFITFRSKVHDAVRDQLYCPLLFCLAIHKTLNIIKQKYPSIKIVAYMDDISLIGSFDLLELVAQEIADSYENIGLHLNASKCLLIGSSAQDLVINDSIVPFTNYSSDAF
ncbi:hypothetical protein P9112_007149 [Eukaryota sp. TZLM1-RC]